ncbi:MULTISPECIES: methyltransferase [Sorangium]|uniref:Uncharacterized protein n=1 Tax=Sorangium cellulosum TaxID=56 RepID=A0A4P2QSM5_SORCE|nr:MULTISPECIES: methyltransferase [Sorangium]AUX33178.1 uncharacterized protein SOCE836_053320 [Sorangium cellulosum]AUX33235.1 uncharacterized protein SOCE836_053890 [Sorangium cellulosum]WCQ92554.1 DNA methyltransferase [Sorangium sp. Soce836]
MSATGRGGAALALPGLEDLVGRHPDDFYRTPVDAVWPVLPHLRPPRRVVDPGCGDGVIAECVIKHWPAAEIICVEKDEQRARDASGRLTCPVWSDDYLRRGAVWEPDWADLVIGNPPYSLALEFLRRSLELVAPVGGEVALLLRLGFLEAERYSERDELLEQHRPDVYVLAKRPRFRGPGDGGDSATYGWLVFGRGRGGRCKRLRSPGRAA